MDRTLSGTELVASWLDGTGAASARRVATGKGEVAAWEIDLPYPAPTGPHLRLALPPRFPELLPKLSVPKENFLKFPHIERDGGICLTNDVIANRDDPVAVAMWALESFQRFAQWCADPGWVEAEFRLDAAAHWRHFCEEWDARVAHAGRQVLLELDALPAAREVDIAVYPDAAIASLVGDPNELARRHQLATGQLTRQRALVVPLPAQFAWVPAAWPRQFAELQALLRANTGQILETPNRRNGRKPSTAPRFVVFTHDGAAFAYEVIESVLPLIQPPALHPLQVRRIDASWALFRDYRPPTARGAKRVLLLGCGSLGSAIAEALARGGVGRLHLVDYELMESENTARHTLGMAELRRFKAEQVQQQILRSVPGVKVTHDPFTAERVLTKSIFEPYDMIVDCTGDWRVREVLGQLAGDRVGDAGIVHVWMEPFAAAAHVVAFSGDDRWPNPEFADRIHLGRWGERGFVRTAGCGSAFSPYGAAECLEIAGFASQCLLERLDNPGGSRVSTWTRPRSYFEERNCEEVSSQVPNTPGMRSTTFTRGLGDLTHGV